MDCVHSKYRNYKIFQGEKTMSTGIEQLCLILSSTSHLLGGTQLCHAGALPWWEQAEMLILLPGTCTLARPRQAAGSGWACSGLPEVQGMLGTVLSGCLGGRLWHYRGNQSILNGKQAQAENQPTANSTP